MSEVSDYLWVVIFGGFIALYNAWGIGANDCANSFATSVGAKVLTLKKAIYVAAIFEFSGALLMGSHVTDTIRKKIVETDMFEANPEVLMLGMMCADFCLSYLANNSYLFSLSSINNTFYYWCYCRIFISIWWCQFCSMG